MPPVPVLPPPSSFSTSFLSSFSSISSSSTSPRSVPAPVGTYAAIGHSWLRSMMLALLGFNANMASRCRHDRRRECDDSVRDDDRESERSLGITRSIASRLNPLASDRSDWSSDLIFQALGSPRGLPASRRF